MTKKEIPAGKPTVATEGASIGTETHDEFLLEKLFPETGRLLSPYAVPKANDESVLVAFDTNALLLPYQIGRDDLGAIGTVYRLLSKQKRLFAPARAIREFVRLRERKLADMIAGLNDKSSRIAGAESKLSPVLEGVEGYAELEAAAKEIEKARRNYLQVHAKLVDQMRAWRGNDPVTALYNEVFAPGTIVDHDGSNEETSAQWARRKEQGVPPGYKDGGKSDGGIGDFLIWCSIVKVARQGRDLIFVTGEEKADWFVRAGGEPLYPRPELVDEYRGASGGRNVRFSTLHELLGEMQAPASVVSEVRAVEDRANTAIQSALGATIDTSTRPPARVETFHYGAGRTIVSVGAVATFPLVFGGADEGGLNLYASDGVPRILKLADVPEGTRIFPRELGGATSVCNLRPGDVFVGENREGRIIVGRIIGFSPDLDDPSQGQASFAYRTFVADGRPYAP